RQRAQLYSPSHTARRQANLPPVHSDRKYKSKRGASTQDITDPSGRRRVETQLALLEPLDTTSRRLEADESPDALQFGEFFFQLRPAGLGVCQRSAGEEQQQASTREHDGLLNWGERGPQTVIPGIGVASENRSRSTYPS